MFGIEFRTKKSAGAYVYLPPCMELGGSKDQYVWNLIKISLIVYCPKCSFALFSNKVPLLQKMKNFESGYGEYSFINPSEDVIKLCKEVEQHFQNHEHILMEKRNEVEFLTLQTSRSANMDVLFTVLMNSHKEDDGTTQVYALMKIIIAKCTKICLNYLAKCISEQFVDNWKGRIRHNSTKEILLQHRWSFFKINVAENSLLIIK